MSKTNQLESSIINHVLGGVAYPPPTQWWVSIHESNPGENPTLNLAPERGTRKQVTSWIISGGQALNENALTFDPVPNGQSWSIGYAVVWDSPTGGVPLYHGTLTNPQTKTEGQTFQIDAQALSIVEL